MARKWTAILVCLVYLVVFTVNATAEGINPRYAFARRISAELRLSNGTAEVSGKITPNGGYETQITVRLQRYNNGGWETLSYWTGHNANGTSEAGGTRYVLEGHDYRAYAIGKVYDGNGNLLETATGYSVVYSY